MPHRKQLYQSKYSSLSQENALKTLWRISPPSCTQSPFLLLPLRDRFCFPTPWIWDWLWLVECSRVVWLGAQAPRGLTVFAFALLAHCCCSMREPENTTWRHIGYLFYILGYNPIPYYLFYCLYCFSFGHWELFRLVLCPCDMTTWVIFSVFSYFLTLQNTPGSLCIFSVPALESAISPKSTGSLIGEWHRKQHVGPWCACCYENSIVSKPFQWTEVGNTCTCINTHIHICIHTYLWLFMYLSVCILS